MQGSDQPAGERRLAGGKLIYDEPAENVARLRIVNPEKRGALDHEILDAFAHEVPLIQARCLIVTGTGKVFSAGYDIGALPADRFAEAAEKLVAHPFAEAITAIERFAYPTIAALNGHTIGGGLELALACDLRVCAGAAELGMPPAKLGLVYGHAGLDKFIQTIGPARTSELFYSAININAEKALQWGLVNDVRDADEVADAALALAATIAGNAPLSLSGNKQVIRTLLTHAPIDPAVEAELVELRRSCFLSEDFREGVRAFGEKRPPRWTGR
ncbi:MAG: enoyl-CoA hydratase/isomerase family protein [Thermoleophilia bacterium]|nr:enoyl-CoA hydratase/isomerase family protein [Thermoleophilia bacterium]